MNVLAPLLVWLSALAIGGASIAIALLRTRAARHDIERRTDLVVREVGTTVVEIPTAGARIVAQANKHLRDVFAFGIPYRWGMHANAATLLVMAAAGATVSWVLLHTVFQLASWIAGTLTVAAAYFVPRQLLSYQENHAEQQFLNLFPNAIDMIVRMVRAGLPVMAAIRTVGNEAPPPVNGVFSSLADQVDIGILFEDALILAAERIGLPDFRFFAVAVSLQHGTGGNIATALEVLSDIVRRRRAMRMRAKATTGEVRVSAYVLSSLPFFVITVLMILNPAYLAPLVTDPRGNVIIGAAIVSLCTGLLTMRWMMNSATRM